MIKTGLVALGATALGAALALAPAADAAAPAKTKVEIGKTKIGETDVTVKGTVASSDQGCVTGRLVKLVSDVDGIKVGTDEANAKGEWKITFDQQDAPPGMYTATALAVSGCKKGSDTEQIGPNG